MKTFDIPIFIRVFKRPELTRNLLDNISRLNPEKIYFCSDGPRKGNDDDVAKIKQTRDVIDNYEWNNDPYIRKLYLEDNIGFPGILPKGIDWFFEENEYGIFLDDDHEPDLSFFTFCKTLLKDYENHESVFLITGSNFIPDKTRIKSSYFFTKIPSLWGFATWKSVWNSLDHALIQNLDQDSYEKVIKNNVSPKHQFYFFNLFDAFRNGGSNGFDHLFILNMWYKDGLAVVPQNNLIKNHGIAHEDAGSTKISKGIRSLSKLDKSSLVDIVHPDVIKENRKLDDLVMKNVYNKKPPLVKRGVSKIKRIINNV